MAKDPAFLFYPSDYIGGTMGMTFEQKGAYVDLLMMQFNRGHMTSHMIGQVLGQKFDELWPTIKNKFVEDEHGMFYNERLELEKNRRKVFTDSRKNNLTGVNQHTKKKENNGGHMGGHMDGHTTSHMENENINKNKDVFKEKKGFGGKEKTWRTDFETYKQELWTWFDGITRDKAWISEQERFNPNLDILLSIEKSIKNFWGTEAGWKNKKSRKSVDLDWKQTFAKTLDINKVYKQRDQDSKELTAPLKMLS